jgi:hypothetical protein
MAASLVQPILLFLVHLASSPLGHRLLLIGRTGDFIPEILLPFYRSPDLCE